MHISHFVDGCLSVTVQSSISASSKSTALSEAVLFVNCKLELRPKFNCSFATHTINSAIDFGYS